MDAAIEIAKQQALTWTAQYGYHAVIPALLVDPAGLPWAWVFLMLLASEAGKNVWLMYAYGFAVLTIVDHALYAVGALGGRPLVERLGVRFPKLADNFHAAENAIHGREAIAVTFGRFLPFIGRWTGVGAGLAGVPYKCFAIFDAVGVAITVLGFGSVANWVGRKTLDSPHFADMISACVVIGTVATLGGMAWGVFKARAANASS